jgi:hypothetical protein
MTGVLPRLAYLSMTTTFTCSGCSTSATDTDTEILVLRHQITVLQRQLDGDKVRFTATDRALLAALPHQPPQPTLDQLRLLVRPADLPLLAFISTPSSRGYTFPGSSGSATGRVVSRAARSARNAANSVRISARC